MPTVKNSDTLQELRRVTQVQQASEQLPLTLGNQIVPVVEVNPKLLRRARVLATLSRSTTGSPTVLTADTVKETYITGCHFSFVKDVACDIADGGIEVQTKDSTGTTTDIVRAAVLTLTAERGDVFATFDPAFQVAKGATVTITGAFTAGKLIRNICILGYTVDNASG